LHSPSLSAAKLENVAFFVALLIALVIATIVLFITPPAWFPAPISALATAYDAQFSRTLWLTAVGFFAVQLLLIYVVLRFRKRGRPAAQFIGNTRVEIIWTAVTAIVFFAVALMGMPVFTVPHLGPEPAGAEIIEVDAHQFAWNFRYPGPDGKFGRTDLKLINDAGGNPLGLDPSDPAGKDDIVVSTLRVPADRDIVLTLKSRDVIHDFFVRELRVKQDAVPGMDIPYRFRVDKVGSYEIACAELCGLGHSQMRAVMLVIPAPDYDQWKKNAKPQ
jgi:cytochrome c oxidase subunit 2